MDGVMIRRRGRETEEQNEAMWRGAKEKADG